MNGIKHTVFIDDFNQNLAAIYFLKQDISRTIRDYKKSSQKNSTIFNLKASK